MASHPSPLGIGRRAPLQTRLDRRAKPRLELDRWGLVRVRIGAFDQLRFDLAMLSSDDGLTGEALWVAEVAAQPATPVGLAFPWATVAPGVLVVSDVLAITTNVLLLDDAGCLAAPQDGAYLARVVHGLPWQAQVLRRLLP